VQTVRYSLGQDVHDTNVVHLPQNSHCPNRENVRLSLF
jgi:hypothetical protein